MKISRDYLEDMEKMGSQKWRMKEKLMSKKIYVNLIEDFNSTFY